MIALFERLRSPAARVTRAAGPPERLVIAMFVLGGVADLGIVLAAGAVLPWAVYVLPPTVLTLVVSVQDRDGWAIRSAIATVGLEQRRRRAGRKLPITAGAARAWLASEPSETAALDRMSVLVTAGRYEEALADLAAFTPVTAEDRVRVARLESTIGAAIDPSHDIDVAAVASASRDLPEVDTRYHVLSAAWSQAWLDVLNHRPWRRRFAVVARQFAPYALPWPVRLIIAVQQCAAPIACVLAFAILFPIVGFLG